jgi:hypothetical protein
MTGNWGLLVLAATLFFPSCLVVLKAQSYKDELAEFDHPVGKLPLWGIRMCGAFLGALGLFVVYDFARTLLVH